MNQKENRIEETLNMASRVQKVSPSDDLMNRLRSIPTSVKQGYDKVPTKVIWLAAASIAILICLNFVSLNNYSDSETQDTEQVDSYFSYMKTL